MPSTLLTMTRRDGARIAKFRIPGLLRRLMILVELERRWRLGVVLLLPPSMRPPPAAAAKLGVGVGSLVPAKIPSIPRKLLRRHEKKTVIGFPVYLLRVAVSRRHGAAAQFNLIRNKFILENKTTRTKSRVQRRRIEILFSGFLKRGAKIWV